MVEKAHIVNDFVLLRDLLKSPQMTNFNSSDILNK
jgi:hypothetical protein